MSRKLPTSEYDNHGDFYYDCIKRRLADEDSFLKLTMDVVLRLLGNVEGLKICDLACGEGHLSRKLAGLGAQVMGVDLSENLLLHAQEDSSASEIRFVRDDAQELASFSDDSFDIVVCNMSLMDIEDLNGTFRAVARTLKPYGRFVFSVLHPCFASPFTVEDGSPLETDEKGEFVAWRTFNYTNEGKWYSSGSGLRGTFGSIHRKISTYVNALPEAKLNLRRVEEPTLPGPKYDTAAKQLSSKIPRTIIVEAQKPGSDLCSITTNTRV